MLQLACRKGDYQKFKEFSRLVDQKKEPIFIRDFLSISGTTGKTAIPLDEVEPASEIVKHFVTGAMSFGALSKEPVQIPVKAAKTPSVSVQMWTA